MLWLLIICGVGSAAIGFLIWWLIFETEGVYLGKRTVIALYDLYSNRYDGIKQFDDAADLHLISQPLLDMIAPHSDPLVLDIATGTGRLPLILARNARFRGHVIGLDASRRMLNVARHKIDAEHFESFITLICQDAMRLPFPNASFDVVTCLEALEFMPEPRGVLTEMVRVLRPGGLLLTTIRVDTRWMPNRTFSKAKMRAELERLDMVDIVFAVWQDDYTQVWALKSGRSKAIGAARIDELKAKLPEVAII